MHELVRSCTSADSAMPGTLYIGAQVDMGGHVRSVTTSPGGALPSSVAACFGKAMERANFPTPIPDQDSLLVFIVTSCELHKVRS